MDANTDKESINSDKKKFITFYEVLAINNNNTICLDINKIKTEKMKKIIENMFNQ